MKFVCRLRIADFLNPETCLASINTFLNVSDQCTINKLATMKVQLTRPSRKATAQSVQEKNFCYYLYNSCGYAVNDGTKNNKLWGGGNQPLTPESAHKMGCALKEDCSIKGKQVRFLQVIK